MAGSFFCSCGQTFKHSRELEGRSVKCPVCRRVFEAPIMAALVEDPPFYSRASTWVVTALLVVFSCSILTIVAVRASWTQLASRGNPPVPPGSSVSVAPRPNLPPATADSLPVRTDPRASTTWNVSPDPSPAAVTWPETMNLSIPLPLPGRTVVYPATPSPFLTVGVGPGNGNNAAVWNVFEQRQTGKIIEAVESVGFMFAASPDGVYLAAQILPNQEAPGVKLYRFDSGTYERAIVCDQPGFRINAFEFADPTRLVTLTSGRNGSRFVSHFRVWNVTSGDLIHELSVDRPVLRSAWALSPGGRYVAVHSPGSHIEFYDLGLGDVAGQAQFSRQGSNLFQGMSFSPDGSQLAIAMGSLNTRLLFLDLKTGKPIDELEISGKTVASGAYHGTAIEWLGDRGWCLFGTNIVDRRARRVVWTLDVPLGDRLTARRTLPGGWLCVSGSRSKSHLAFLPIPWDRIDASLAAMNSDADAHLKPGDKISLEIQLGELRFGSTGETIGRLTKVFRERLEPDGIVLADDQPLILAVDYSESAGTTLSEDSRNGPNTTGRKVEATKTHLKMKVFSRGRDTPLWSHEFAHDPKIVTIIGNAERNSASARDASFQQLLYALGSQPLPYFIPRDEMLSQLPGTSRPTP